MKPQERPNNAVTAKCLKCGVEFVGVLVNGRVVPSDRVRPADNRVIDALCMECAK